MSGWTPYSSPIQVHRIEVFGRTALDALPCTATRDTLFDTYGPGTYELTSPAIPSSPWRITVQAPKQEGSS